MIEYPCDKCLVAPICKIVCYKVFEFMNRMADGLKHDSEYSKLLPDMPSGIRFKIDELVNENKRFAFPESIQSKRSVILM